MSEASENIYTLNLHHNLVTTPFNNVNALFLIFHEITIHNTPFLRGGVKKWILLYRLKVIDYFSSVSSLYIFLKLFSEIQFNQCFKEHTSNSGTSIRLHR